jgi:hypothetical protein
MNLLNRINSQNLFRVLKHQGLRTRSHEVHPLNVGGKSIANTGTEDLSMSEAVDVSPVQEMERVIELENQHPEKRAVRDIRPPRGIPRWIMTVKRKTRFIIDVLLYKRTEPDQAAWEAQQAAKAEAKIQKAKDDKVIRAIHADANRATSLISRRLQELMFYEKQNDQQKQGRFTIKRVRFDVIAYDWNHVTHMGGNKITFHVDSRPGMLPAGVRIGDLMREEIINEVQYSLDKPISGYAWVHGGTIDMNRTGNNGLPVNVPIDVAWKSMGDNRPMLTFCPGIDENGQFRWKDLTDCPHVVVVGGSNMGKSNMINGILSTFLRNNTPDQLQFVMFDCKAGAEFSFYEGIPHLYKNPYKDEQYDIPGIILELDQAVDAMNRLVHLMRKRMKIIRDAGFKKISDYNRTRKGANRMPYLVVPFDDYISMSIFFGEEANAPLTLLSSQGRAAGIHLILGAQYPKADRVPSVALLNFQVVIAYRLKGGASMSILGDHSAVGLPCAGRCVFQDFDETTILQSPMISDAQVRETVEFAVTGEHNRRASRLDIEEVLQYAYEHFSTISDENGGIGLDIKKLHQAFQGRIGRQRLNDMLKDVDETVVDVSGTGYLVTMKHGRPRRMIRIEEQSTTGPIA